MAGNYYCLVSGLTEYSLESGHKGFDASAIRDQIKKSVSSGDREHIRTLYTFYDIENLISHRNGKHECNVLGNLTQDEIIHALEGDDTAVDTKQEEAVPMRTLPAYLQDVVDAYRLKGHENESEEEPKMDTDKPFEKAIWEAFYLHCSTSKCRFIREYFTFDNTLRNISAAFIARSGGMPIAPQLVGNNEITTALSRSASADFGLRNEIEYVDSIINLLEMRNIIEKEHRIDDIRWDKADEIATFDYFNIDFLLSYLVKVNIIHRWVALDRKLGEAMLERLLGELSDKDILARAENGETN